MDPNATLTLARARAADLIRLLDAGYDDNGDFIGLVADLGEAADQLAEAFTALDGWVSKGGFLPDAWTR